MLFYNFGTLDEFINNNLIENIKQEKNKLEQIISLYQNKKKLSSSNLLDDLDFIIILADSLKEELTYIISLHDKDLEDNYNEIKAELIEYNKKSDELFQKVLDFESNKVENIIDTLVSDFDYKDNNILTISEKTRESIFAL